MSEVFEDSRAASRMVMVIKFSFVGTGTFNEVPVSMKGTRPFSETGRVCEGQAVELHKLKLGHFCFAQEGEVFRTIGPRTPHFDLKSMPNVSYLVRHFWHCARRMISKQAKGAVVSYGIRRVSALTG